MDDIDKKNIEKAKVENVRIASISPALQRAINADIFRPAPKDGWFKRKLKTWMINYIRKEDGRQKRFTVIHKIVKIGFVHPVLKWIKFKWRKFLVDKIDDIPAEWWNNHLRMYFHAFDKGLDDLWMKVFYIQGYNRHVKQYPTPESFLEAFKKSGGFLGYNASHEHRRLIIQLQLTEACEDTMDREWLNMSIMRLTHYMMEHYGVSESERKKVPMPGQFPIYFSTTDKNVNYFMSNINHPVWKVPVEAKKDDEKDSGTASVR